ILTKKDEPWRWEQPQIGAMKTLIELLTTAPALKTIDYSLDAGRIILAVDASLDGWGAVMMQKEKGKVERRHPSRYESGLWKDAEKRYDAGKRECRGLLKALKKLRVYLYGVRLVVETDTNTLVHQLNLPASDLPGAAVTRWLAWLRLFDFEVVHVPGERNSGPDALSRRPHAENDSESDNESDVDDIEEMIDADIYVVWAKATRAMVTRADDSAEIP